MADQYPRRGTNWVEARDFWLALDPPRSYGTVARQFGISDTRVRFVARRDGWQEVADEIDRKALEQTKRRIVRSRSERVQRILGITDGLLEHFDQELDERVKDAKWADLPGVVKLAELLEGEATDRISVGEAQAGFSALMTIALKFIPAAGRRGFLDEVRNTIGDLGAAA